MTTFQIKLIAVVTMLIDHIGVFFFPQAIFLRVIGRLSLPLFTWMIANGAYHTHNINKYLIRLFIFALISQIPFALANQYNPSIADPYRYLNVLFTLFLGLLAIKIIKENNDKLIWLAITAICAFAANILNTDYGAFGVLSIVLFYLFFNSKTYMIISQAVLFFGNQIVNYLKFQHAVIDPLMPKIFLYIELFGLISLVFISLYNGKEGWKTKYLLYIIYPLQFLVIFLILRLS